MKPNKIIAVINILLLIISMGIITPVTFDKDLIEKVIIVFTLLMGIIVSFALIYEKDKSEIIEKYYKLKNELQESAKNYNKARDVLTQYVLVQSKGVYNKNDIEEAFVAGYHCKPNGKDLGVYAEEYVNNIKNEGSSFI